jgi:hypothetical protein
LLIERETNQLDGVIFSSKGFESPDYISNDPIKARLLIGASIALLAGIIQVREKKLFLRLD